MDDESGGAYRVSQNTPESMTSDRDWVRLKLDKQYERSIEKLARQWGWRVRWDLHGPGIQSCPLVRTQEHDRGQPPRLLVAERIADAANAGDSQAYRQVRWATQDHFNLGFPRTLPRPNVESGASRQTGSIEDARAHGQVFFPWYNTAHRHSGLGLLTPHDVHYGLADQRVAARTGVLAAAYAAHPERFVAGLPRPPARPTEVWINPPPPTAASTPNPAPTGSEEQPFALRAPYSTQRTRDDRTYVPRLNDFRPHRPKRRPRSRPTEQR